MVNDALYNSKITAITPVEYACGSSQIYGLYKNGKKICNDKRTLALKNIMEGK